MPAILLNCKVFFFYNLYIFRVFSLRAGLFLENTFTPRNCSVQPPSALAGHTEQLHRSSWSLKPCSSSAFTLSPPRFILPFWGIEPTPFQWQAGFSHLKIRHFDTPETHSNRIGPYPDSSGLNMIWICPVSCHVWSTVFAWSSYRPHVLVVSWQSIKSRRHNTTPGTIKEAAKYRYHEGFKSLFKIHGNQFCIC